MTTATRETAQATVQAVEYRLHEEFSMATRHELADAIDKALSDERRNERERICRILCEWCGNDAYKLVFHHEEWRHYRKTDMYVEYCAAAAIRNDSEGD